MRQIVQPFAILLVVLAVLATLTIDPARSKSVKETEPLVQVAEDIKGQIVQIEVRLPDGETGFGTGFWISESYIATCWHVISKSPNGSYLIKSAVDSFFDLSKNNISAANWEVFEARMVAKDERNDLAIIKVKHSPFGGKPRIFSQMDDVELSAHFKKTVLQVGLPKNGQTILLAGYPLALPYLVVQQGTVASTTYDLPGSEGAIRILLSTVANPGNSGGPIFDNEGKVVGVLNSGFTNPQTGIAMAVPSFYVEKLFKSIDLEAEEKKDRQ